MWFREREREVVSREIERVRVRRHFEISKSVKNDKAGP